MKLFEELFESKLDKKVIKEANLGALEKLVSGKKISKGEVKTAVSSIISVIDWCEKAAKKKWIDDLGDWLEDDIYDAVEAQSQ